MGLTAAVLLGGCADLMKRSAVAPDWFQAKAVEVKGEGYPSLKDIPVTRGTNAKGAEAWKTEAASLKAEAAKLEAKTTEGEAIPTDEEVRARAAQLRATVDPSAPATPGTASK